MFLIVLFVWFQSGGDNLLENKDQYGKTVVHYAAARCNVDVRILVSLGKDATHVNCSRQIFLANRLYKGSRDLAIQIW